MELGTTVHLLGDRDSVLEDLSRQKGTKPSHLQPSVRRQSAEVTSPGWRSLQGLQVQEGPAGGGGMCRCLLRVLIAQWCPE